jgi:putative transport protein
LELRYGQAIRFSRLQHGATADDVQAPGDDARLRRGDIVTVVGQIDLVEQVTRELGHTATESLESSRAGVDFRRITLSDEDLAGRTIGDLELMRRFGAKVIRVRRGDVDALASDEFVLQPGDRLRIIAPRQQIGAVTAYLGDSERGLSDLRPMVLGTGMTLGLLLGSIVLPLPGMAFSMGPAAGTLLVGLVFGKVGRIGPFLTTMPHTAGQTMADFGLLAFLAHAGTRAGIQLGTALATGDGMRIFVLGIAITASVSCGIFVVMRRAFAMGRTRLAGVLAAAHTQPAVLAFANGRTGYDSRVAHGYALVYPVALIVKILIAKVLGSL